MKNEPSAQLIRRKHNLEYMLNWAGQIQPNKIADLPQEKRMAFEDNVAKLRQELKRVNEALCD